MLSNRSLAGIAAIATLRANELLQSRRGKYERTQEHRSRRRKEQSSYTAARDILPGSKFSESGDDRSCSQLQTSSKEDHTPNSPMQFFAPEEAALATDGGSPEALYARMTEPEVIEDIQISDATVQKDRRALYLGEAFSLAFVVKTICAPEANITDSVKVHYPVPTSTRGTQSLCDNYGSLGPDVLVFLRARGALMLPHQDVSDALVSAFFECFHSAYPVLDREEFETRHRQGQGSLLALQTIYFLGATVCSENVLKQGGFISREQARRTFYQRAKCLYDADYEKDGTLITAALFLLGFWWETPQDQKDTWHYLGCAISLAQTLGMHRSTERSRLGPKTRSLWKRIWWFIYIRDRHAAASLGRPYRIKDEDCDVEELCEADFTTDNQTTLTTIIRQKPYHAAYMVNMSKLAVFLGKILSTRFSPLNHGDDCSIAACGFYLRQWEEELPDEMQLRALGRQLDAAFWAANLHAAYHNAEILLFRPTQLSTCSDIETQRNQYAIRAANSTTRIAEDLLTVNLLRESQIHFIPALFAALGIHAIVIQNSGDLSRQVTENLARQCMLALNELSKSWPVGSWILRLFKKLMGRLMVQSAESEGTQSSEKHKTTRLPNNPVPERQPNTTVITENSLKLNERQEEASITVPDAMTNVPLFDLDFMFQPSLSEIDIPFTDSTLGEFEWMK